MGQMQRKSKGRRKSIKGLLATLIILLIALAGWSLVDIWQDNHQPAAEQISQALAKTWECSQYSFTAIAAREQETEIVILGQLEGTVQGENRHLKGTIDVVNADFELYLIGGDYYRRSNTDDSWIKVADFGLEATRNLVAEIDPLAMLQLPPAFEAEYLGKERLDGKKYRKYQLVNYTPAEYLSYGWQDMVLTLWLDRRNCLKRAEICATEKNDSSKQLTLSVDFDLACSVEPLQAPQNQR